MTAEEMFEKLGYRKKYFFNKENGFFYENEMDDTFVDFRTDIKKVSVGYNYELFSEFTKVDVETQVLKAINMQVKELGW